MSRALFGSFPSIPQSQRSPVLKEVSAYIASLGARVLRPIEEAVALTSSSGTEIWRIENCQPVPLPKSDYGKFYMGDSYIVLQTKTGKGGSNLYDIHFWIGKDTSQDEAGTAALKAIELDAVLGGRAVQHRELQEEFETRLYVCGGKRVVKLRQVPFARTSLNHDDIFILDTQNKVYQFNGANSNIQEREKALEVIQ
ncbi:hypothetical protein V6N13_014225 [Hibiscus sabdariffa]|uniref:Gelsolin-like domain-containing protein n=1 Tax=Hibiscus sabdariffa TaxID=183260 RepID=A0ABR2RV60_9ROSI